MPTSSVAPIVVQLSPTIGRVLVVGGGPVGARKVRKLVAGNMDVRWVTGATPTVDLADIGEAVKALSGSVAIERRDYRADDLAAIAWVVLATNSVELHKEICSIAQSRNILVTDAAFGLSTATFAATRQLDDVNVSVTTTDRRAGRAKQIAEYLAAQYQQGELALPTGGAV